MTRHVVYLYNHHVFMFEKELVLNFWSETRNLQVAQQQFLHLGISSLCFVQRFSLRSFIHSQTSSQLHIRDIIHIYSEIFIWPMKQAQSSCSYTTAELLIKQHITYSEHCKPQLIRFCPSLLHYDNTYCCGLNLNITSC